MRKYIYIMGITCFCMAFTSCYEERHTDLLQKEALNYVLKVPQGNNSWDNDIAPNIRRL